MSMYQASKRCRDWCRHRKSAHYCIRSFSWANGKRLTATTARWRQRKLLCVLCNNTQTLFLLERGQVFGVAYISVFALPFLRTSCVWLYSSLPLFFSFPLSLCHTLTILFSFFFCRFFNAYVQGVAYATIRGVTRLTLIVHYIGNISRRRTCAKLWMCICILHGMIVAHFVFLPIEMKSGFLVVFAELLNQSAVVN